MYPGVSSKYKIYQTHRIMKIDFFFLKYFKHCNILHFPSKAISLHLHQLSSNTRLTLYMHVKNIDDKA